MIPDFIVQKYDISVNEGGGGKNKKVSIIGMLENKLVPTIDRDVMETFSMVVLIVGRTHFSVAGPFGS